MRTAYDEMCLLGYEVTPTWVRRPEEVDPDLGMPPGYLGDALWVILFEGVHAEGLPRVASLVMCMDTPEELAANASRLIPHRETACSAMLDALREQP